MSIKTKSLTGRYTLSPDAMRTSAMIALVISIVVIAGGGIVRVTGSGLGCPTWPTCSGSSLVDSPALGVHGLIEFGNRLVTGLLIAAIAWAVVAARLQRPRDRVLEWLAWSQVALVVTNAVAGGITVIVKLNPWLVATHFLLAIALLTSTALAWTRATQLASARAPAPRRLNPANLSFAVSRGSVALTLLTLALIVVGTLVAGSGPHSGDSSAVPRMGLDWTTLVWIHATIATIVVVTAVVLLVRVPRGLPLRRLVVIFLLVLLGQGAVGSVQALSGLPVALVAIHVVGSALVWVGALRILLESAAVPALTRRSQ